MRARCRTGSEQDESECAGCKHSIPSRETIINNDSIAGSNSQSGNEGQFSQLMQWVGVERSGGGEVRETEGAEGR